MFFVFSVLRQQRIKPVFYHMFGSGVVENLNDFRPLLTIVLDIKQNFVILLIRPLAFVFVAVEVIEPSLSAVFGGLKDATI